MEVYIKTRNAPRIAKAVVVMAITANTVAVDAVAYTIAELDSCNSPLDSSSVYTVVNGGRNTLGGWSHIEKANPTGEYAALSLDDADYAITAEKFLPNDSCDGVATQNAVLVMKLSDWTRQHSNGLEALLDVNTVSFADVDHVLVDLKVVASSTRVADLDELRARYGKLLSDEQFSVFDRGKVNLGVTLFEGGASDQSTRSLNAELFIEIDQELLADKWLRIKMPLSHFSFYYQRDYKDTMADANEHRGTKIAGLRINPESSHGEQLRNLLGDQWHEDLPETFKEIGLEIRRIEFIAN